MAKKNKKNQIKSIKNNNIDILIEEIKLLNKNICINNELIENQQKQKNENLNEDKNIQKEKINVFKFLFFTRKNTSSKDLSLFMRLLLTIAFYFFRMCCWFIFAFSCKDIILNMLNSIDITYLLTKIIILIISFIFAKVSLSASIVTNEIEDINILSGVLSGVAGFLGFIVALIAFLYQIF